MYIHVYIQINIHHVLYMNDVHVHFQCCCPQIYPRTMDGFKMRPAKLAVQGISVAIPTGECFGLLGVNGDYY